MRNGLRFLAAGALLAVATALSAAEFAIVPEESIVSIVTRKGGLASGLAHNHLIVAGAYEAEVRIDPDSPAVTRLGLRTRAEDLVVDSPELREVWQSRLEELGLLSGPFGEISEKDRTKVREAMLGRKQLDAASFPEISGSILEVLDVAGDDPEFPYRARIAIEAHGQRVEREVRGRFERSGDEIVLEAVGELRFTDFGIKPYSAFLGAVRNRDEFGLYLRLTAVESDPVDRNAANP